MDSLILKSQIKTERVPVSFVRDIIHQIDWTNRLIGIKGARGAGKTTLLLQYIKTQIENKDKALYVSLDDLYFSRHSLYSMADEWVKNGGRFLFLDEVHRYAGWSQEVKNIYDDFNELKVVFTGSSIIHLSRSKGDLSRRAVMYELRGLSFREYLQLQTGFEFKTLNLSDVIGNHQKIALSISSKLKPLEHFHKYNKTGYYPYFLENQEMYLLKLAETVNLIIETDIPVIYNISYASVDKLKKLLSVIAESVPFKPNVLKLSEQVGVTRNSISEFLHLLEDARLLFLLHSQGKGITRMQKPDKIFLYHPNLNHSLAPEKPDIGAMREGFFVNQVASVYSVNYTHTGDFLVDNKFVFEVGGKGKNEKQIKNVSNAFIAADNIESGYKNKIPLWLLGFLY